MAHFKGRSFKGTSGVVEATAQIVGHTHEAELRMKLGSTSVKGLLAILGIAFI
ncbi:DUF3898 domain-containing protein [Peribacillus butanolivorans]|uniref:DUF3898 domain-containing protein n=1 Tax=Peribacillus butanolivorans TaxID=421767 RepID=UPI0035DA43B3